MSYLGLGVASSALVASGTGNAFTTAPSMASTFSSVGMVNTGSLIVNRIVTSTTPYVVLSTDYFISMDSTGAIKTVHLPDAPTTNRVFVVKDFAGTAAAFNITITTVGGVVLIDGAASYVMTTNYQSVQLLFNGTSYEVY